ASTLALARETRHADPTACIRSCRSLSSECRRLRGRGRPRRRLAHLLAGSHPHLLLRLRLPQRRSERTRRRRLPPLSEFSSNLPVQTQAVGALSSQIKKNLLFTLRFPAPLVLGSLDVHRLSYLLTRCPFPRNPHRGHVQDAAVRVDGSACRWQCSGLAETSAPFPCHLNPSIRLPRYLPA
ncbi:hypothetical protein DFH11DRAFT_1879083, partial [Phellopilus nigrolimitatus]